MQTHLESGPSVGGDDEGEQVDLVGMQRVPVLGGGHHAPAQQHAAVRGVHALHVTVQEILNLAVKS